jgi:hypothetical protein
MDDKKLAKRWWTAACGLDCGSCTIHLRTREELDFWQKKNVDPEKIRCDGCRSDRSKRHWSPDCKILECCVYKSGLEFCAQCPDFPCPILEEWGKEWDHHAQAVKNLLKMKETGIDDWIKGHDKPVS